jgi:hypothetical protein
MSRKKTTQELRAVAAANLKAAQEAVKAVEPKTTQNSTPTTSAPTPPEVTSTPDTELLHKVADFTAGSKIRFFCMKCKAAKSTKIDEVYNTLQGHKRAKGTCPTCGKKVTRGHLDMQPKAV